MDMDKEEQLIAVYLIVSKQYFEYQKTNVVRMSNNHKISFTDEEALTIYLYGIMNKRFEMKDMYKDIKSWFGSWFPLMPSYVAFVNRLNFLSPVIPILCERIQESLMMNSGLEMSDVDRVIDSLPIVLAKEKRSHGAKVAREIANKSYCSSKNMWYYGIKLHVLARKRIWALPFPEYAIMSSASYNDLKALREFSAQLSDVNLYGDKAYLDEEFQKNLKKEQLVDIRTPVKKNKGQEFLDAADQWWSTAVSRMRQPIESLFNWIEEKTGIQRASKVRSYNGLVVHVFGRLTAALLLFVLNS